VDSPGDHAGHRRPGPDDPHPGPHDRRAVQAAKYSEEALARTASRADNRRSRRPGGHGAWKKSSASGHRPPSGQPGPAGGRRRRLLFRRIHRGCRIDNPVRNANNGILAAEDRSPAQDAHVPRAGDHPAAVRPGRRLHVHPGRSRPDLQSHPRAGAADRGQGRPQAAASGPQPTTGGLPATSGFLPHSRAGRCPRG
jgi:hypothetical protein